MHPHLKSLLVKAGCDPKATDEEAKAFHDGLSAEKKDSLSKQLAAMMDDGDDTATRALPTGGDPHPDSSALSAKKIEEIASQAALAAVQAILKTDPTKARLSAASPAKDDDDVALEVEQKRVGRVRGLAALHKGIVDDGEVNRIVGEGGSFEDARRKMLALIASKAKPVASVSVSEDKRIAALRVAIPQAIMLRAGVGENDSKKTEKIWKTLGTTQHEETERLRGHTVLDMFRTYLVALGVPSHEVYDLSRTRLASALGPRGMRSTFPRMAALAESTSDFANITLDAINKALRFNYLDAKRTWPIWCEKKFNADFKTFNSIALSEAPSMKSANEGGEIKYVTLSDSKEKGTLVTYKAGIRLTRNAIINDDLDAFNAIPRLQANSAARLEDDVAYALITANAALGADSIALFDAITHKNYTSSGGAPSVSNLQIGSTAMKKQKGLAGAARLELEPKFLLVPSSIEETTKELIGSDVLIASQSSSASAPTTVGNKNPYFNRYQVVGSVRLDDNSATKWYLFADFRDGQISTFMLYFLTDEPEPVLRQETDFDTEDVKYLVRHTVAGLVPDYRGVYLNAGA